MAVNPTRTPGQVWVANTPPNKDHITQLLSELITGVDGLDPRSVPIYATRASAVSGAGQLAAASALPTQVSRIFVQNGTSLEIRSRAATADDPLYNSPASWGVVQRQDVTAEASARTAALSAEATARTAAIAVETAARTTAVTNEANARIAGDSATLAAAVDADLRILSEDRQVVFVGAPRATIDANGAATSANVTNWVFPTPAAAAGDAGRFRAQVATAGTIRFGVYRLVSGNLVRVRSRDVAVAVGLVDLPVGLHLEAGEYLGAFMGTARVRFVSGGGTGYYFDNSTSDRSVITASNINTTNLLVAQFVVYQGSSPSVADREAQAATVAGLNGRVERLEYGGRDLQPFNMTDDARLADPAASAASAWNFVFDSLRPAGTVVRVEFWARAAGTLRLGAYVRSGSSFSRRAFVDVEAVVGFNRFEVDLEVRAGEYVGYKPFAAIVPFQSNSPLGTETGVWLSNNTADQGTFTGTQNLTQQHLIKITQAIGGAGGAAAAASAEQSEQRILSVVQTQTGNDVAVTVKVVNSAGAETTATGTFTIPATASTFRYDLIVYEHGTGAVSRLAGTERNDAANVQPQVSVAGQQAVLRIRAGTSGITSIATVPEMVGAVPRASRALMDRALTAGRRALPRLMARIARGQSIRILGFGDSITQLRRGTGSAPTTTANGSDRDAITGVYLTGSGIYDAAAIAAIPVFTAVQLGRADDGAGAIHSRIGIIWGIVERLERRGYVLGTDLWYDNLGIAGTSSADAWDDATDLPKAWLAAVPTAGGAVPNVVVLALGMNERGYAAGREARYMKIVNWLRAQGIEVIILGVARAVATINDTRWTNAMLARVARRCDAAYIPLEAIWEDAVIGALGLNIEDVCHANRGVNANHPGTIELISDGRVAGEIIP